MRYLTAFIFLSSLLAGVLSPAGAEPIPAPPELPVRSYILIDAYSGQTLAELNSDERMEPASITKLMTGYVLYKRLQEGVAKLDDMVTISEKAWRMEGSRMYVELGSQVPVKDLLLGMVVQSGNDATVALAEYIAGSESAFVELMKQQAAELGLANSHFMNSEGLPDPNHYMSARDIATLGRAIIRNFPEYYKGYSIREFTYNKIKQQNRNRLLWQDSSVDGLKTGHTNSAGYCLVASAKRGDMRLIAVVLGAKNEKDRFRASQELLNYGFSFFETQKIYNANESLTEARVWKGDKNRLPAGVVGGFYVTLPKGRAEGLQAVMNVDPDIIAPVQQGDPVGEVTATLDGQIINKTPLTALENVGEAGLLGRLWDGLILMILSLFR